MPKKQDDALTIPVRFRAHEIAAIALLMRKRGLTQADAIRTAVVEAAALVLNDERKG